MLDRLESPPGLAPIAFGVKAPQRVATLPQGRGYLWSAQVKAVRQGQFSKVFANVLFMESNDTAYVFGIEAPDARPGGLPADVADQQQLFIQFLREQTDDDIRALGMLAKVFRGHEYGCEVAATAAYVVAREVSLNLGVGYQTESGAYELVGIHKDDELVTQARLAALSAGLQHQ
ncbi:hypothetical protein [Aquabacterium sp. CECT 9606]|uniref:hypothetical protein n=1 Tax=Aquabacterium sp. CECT 9606 TaxID=2845822 RepID=UPI001E39EAC2|nr:hypothetical protein [Aquabacterium sp. CECT 9606]CAH0348071.1 hypothetical protein AQB9606_00292 [Aquabacterium sp. CECT 9606]